MLYLSRLCVTVSCCLAAAIVTLPSCAAQTQMPTPKLDGIAHAAVRVSNLEKSRAFYKELGYEEAFAKSHDGVPTESFIKVNDTQFIELYPQEKMSQQIGFLHVCFESHDLEALNQAYVARGLTPSAVKRAGAGNLLFTMRGPEEQNLEYTQYMPGSMHTNDRGKHLGAGRISDRIVAVSIEMQNTKAAREYYLSKLAFTLAEPAVPSTGSGHIWLALPGQTGERVEISPRVPGGAFQIYFAVPDLHRAAAELKAAHLTFAKLKGCLSVQDPDGNRVVFVQVNQH